MSSVPKAVVLHWQSSISLLQNACPYEIRSTFELVASCCSVLADCMKFSYFDQFHTLISLHDDKYNKWRGKDTEGNFKMRLHSLEGFFLLQFYLNFHVMTQNWTVLRYFYHWCPFVSLAFTEALAAHDFRIHFSLYVNKISIHKKAPWQSISQMEVLI